MSKTDPVVEPHRSPAARLLRLWGLPLVLGSALALVLLMFMNPSNGSAQSSQAPRPAPIDGDRAYGYLTALCNFGPRKAGSAANAKQREFVVAHFKKLGATIKEQKFSGVDAMTRKRVEMVNVVASWFPDRTERVVISAHYDTRPFADRDPDPANWSSNYNPAKPPRPFLGANDGASGVALLMEIAHHLKEDATPWGMDLVLFDGEELVYDDGQGPKRGEYFLGSKEFARQYKRRKPEWRYVAGFVLDMVGGKDGEFPIEPASQTLAGALVRDVWGVAARLNSPVFSTNFGREVQDDHLPMNDVGIRTIDIIDFEYPQWHTADDLPEHCSGKTLAEVGRVVTAWLAQPKPTKGKRR